MKVVVVESPAKAKTINKYLGSDYKVVASYGHVRDLPAKDGSVLPESDFAMSWEVDGKSEKHVKTIVEAVRGADRLFLATDPDREGEAISWHVREVLRSRRALKDLDVKRVVFNEVTKNAASSSKPISHAARSITWSGSRCRRCCGASFPAAVPRAASNRSRCA
jgi:DNA topoisomerase I